MIRYKPQVSHLFKSKIVSYNNLTSLLHRQYCYLYMQSHNLILKVVRFKGPAAQKTFMLGHGESSQQDPNKFVAYESLRSIFALTNQNTAPPVTTDTECIWSFQKVDGEGTNLKARLRLASYLNAQTDSLYFDAKNRAVSFADYHLTMKKITN